jgi:hypothetical protein
MGSAANLSHAALNCRMQSARSLPVRKSPAPPPGAGGALDAIAFVVFEQKRLRHKMRVGWR